MLGIAKKVERVRAALIDALKNRSIAIHAEAAHQPSDQARMSILRAIVLLDLAQILAGLKIDSANEKEDSP